MHVVLKVRDGENWKTEKIENSSGTIEKVSHTLTTLIV